MTYKFEAGNSFAAITLVASSAYAKATPELINAWLTTVSISVGIIYLCFKFYREFKDWKTKKDKKQ